MKKNKFIAAILFGVLALVQFFGLTYVLSTALMEMPSLIYLELIALAVYVIVSVKFFKTADIAVTNGEKRAAAALGVMYFIAIAINFQMFAQLLSLAFAAISQELAMSTVTGVVFMIIRTILLFMALFFTVLNEKEQVDSDEFEQTAELVSKKLEEAEQ